jgi:hypothetical protein
MTKTALLCVALTLMLTACGSSSKTSADEQKLQQQADYWAIDQIERKWHKSASEKDVNMMMSLWAKDATFNIGTETLEGTTQIRDFFRYDAGPFQSKNNWVSVTPADKIRITVSGDKGTIYFDCIYVDRTTGKVAAVVGADQNLQKIDGKWLITSAASATPTL